MRFNQFNPLLTQHQDPAAPGASGSGSPEVVPTPEKAPEEKKDEEEPEPEKEPLPDPKAPPAPSARLNAFQRGALRALGTGDLIARVERAEIGEANAQAEVARLTTENLRLSNELATLETETPKKIEAAAKGRQNEVAKNVHKELTTLGISESEAPGQLTADQSDKTKSRSEFDKMSHPERNAFMASGGKISS